MRASPSPIPHPTEPSVQVSKARCFYSAPKGLQKNESIMLLINRRVGPRPPPSRAEEQRRVQGVRRVRARWEGISKNAAQVCKQPRQPAAREQRRRVQVKCRFVAVVTPPESKPSARRAERRRQECPQRRPVSTPLPDDNSPASASPVGDQPPDAWRAHALRVGGASAKRRARCGATLCASVPASTAAPSEGQPVGYMLVFVSPWGWSVLKDYVSCPHHAGAPRSSSRGGGTGEGDAPQALRTCNRDATRELQPPPRLHTRARTCVLESAAVC